MIVSVGNNELPYSVDGNAGETVKLSLLVAVLAKLLHEAAVGIEDLYSVIRGVSDDDGVIGPDGDAAGPRETSGFAPPTTYLEQLLAFLQVLTPRGGTYHCLGDTDRRRSCCRGSGRALHVF